MADEKVCSQCGAAIVGTPWAFPLTDMRVDARDRFCSEKCVDKHEATLAPGAEPKEKP